MAKRGAAAIMSRLINGSFPAEIARFVLRLDFAKRDHQQMARLQAKASERTLNSKDRAELENYLRAADILALLQSKARRSLKRQKGA
jgi:hypothetical protein